MEETGVPGGNHQRTASNWRASAQSGGLNLGRSGVKHSELRRDESDALTHPAAAAPGLPISFYIFPYLPGIFFKHLLIMVGYGGGHSTIIS